MSTPPPALGDGDVEAMPSRELLGDVVARGQAGDFFITKSRAGVAFVEAADARAVLSATAHRFGRSPELTQLRRMALQLREVDFVEASGDGAESEAFIGRQLVRARDVLQSEMAPNEAFERVDEVHAVLRVFAQARPVAGQADAQLMAAQWPGVRASSRETLKEALVGLEPVRVRALRRVLRFTEVAVEYHALRALREVCAHYKEYKKAAERAMAVFEAPLAQKLRARWSHTRVAEPLMAAMDAVHGASFASEGDVLRVPVSAYAERVENAANAAVRGYHTLIRLQHVRTAIALLENESARGSFAHLRAAMAPFVMFIDDDFERTRSDILKRVRTQSDERQRELRVIARRVTSGFAAQMLSLAERWHQVAHPDAVEAGGAEGVRAALDALLQQPGHGIVFTSGTHTVMRFIKLTVTRVLKAARAAEPWASDALDEWARNTTLALVQWMAPSTRMHDLSPRAVLEAYAMSLLVREVVRDQHAPGRANV